MKKCAKILSLLLAATMVVGCTAKPAPSTTTSNPSSTPVEKTSYTFPLKEKAAFSIGTVTADGKPSNADVKIWKDREAETDVSITWEETLFGAWSNKKSTVFTAKNLPDAFMLRGLVTDEELASYGAAGTFIALQDYIDAYMPNLSKYLAENPEWRQAITAPDGNIYGLPDIDATAYTSDMIPYINKDWAAKVMPDVDLSKPMDIETFEKLLIAFKNTDLNGNGKADEIPWSTVVSGAAGNTLLRWSASFGIFDSYKDSQNTSHLYLDGKTVKYAPMEENYKEFVKWLNKLWSQGLLDAETFTMDTQMQDAKYKDPIRKVGLLYCWRDSGWQRSAEDTDYVVIPPLKTSITDPTWMDASPVTINRNGMMVTKSCENPELLLAWADQMYEPYNSLSMNTAQAMGEHIKKNDDGTTTQLRAIDWNREGEYNLMPGNYTKMAILTKETFEKQDVKPPVFTQKTPIDTMMSSYYSDTLSLIPTSVWLTADEGKNVAIYRTDLDPYVLDCFARWVTKGGIDAEWDNYVKTLKDMNVDKLVAIYQANCDKLG